MGDGNGDGSVCRPVHGEAPNMAIAEGTRLTCTNPDCPCRLLVEQPCPHGDDYRCGCGHPFTTADADPPTVTPGA
jgi:hypothetical protein